MTLMNDEDEKIRIDRMTNAEEKYRKLPAFMQNNFTFANCYFEELDTIIRSCIFKLPKTDEITTKEILIPMVALLYNYLDESDYDRINHHIWWLYNININ